MEYSLNYLNSITNLKELTLGQFINFLNLIGLEVDEVSKKKLKTNTFSSLENIKLLIKIPANREDLLIENFFIDELSTIFRFEIFHFWKKIKKNYNFLLKQKYIQYSTYQTVNIKSELSSIVTYVIELEKFEEKSSPLWISNKLKNFGLETKNNFQDILNLVISEWGQMLNISCLDSNDISSYTVCRLEKIEYFQDSEQKLIELLPGTIVLKDAKNNILTVFGLMNISQKSFEKKNFLIETTFYDIEQNSSKIHILNPKSSLKSFRKLFLEKIKYSFQRLLTLIEILEYSSSIIPIKYSTLNEKIELSTHKILKLKTESLKNILNIDKIDQTIFENSGLKIICKTKKEIYFQIPNSRRDLKREIDLIEEYSRFFGYKNFQEIFPIKNEQKNCQSNETISFLKEVFLNYGFSEIVTNSLKEYSLTKKSSIYLTNPLNSELSCLRQSLIPKLLEIFTSNLRFSSTLTNFFEIGRVFNQYNTEIIEENKIGGIYQLPKMTYSKENELDWFISLGFLENILTLFGFTNIQKEKLKIIPSFAHPTRSIILKDNEKIIGFFGQISPKDEHFSFLKKPTYFFEFNLIHFQIFKQYTIPTIYKDYSKYPKITKDISFICLKNNNLREIKCFLENNIHNLKAVYFFDIYFDKKNFDFINLGIRFEFQSFTTTLTNEAIEKEIEKAKSLLISKFDAKLNE